jgi:hypothetical protein
MKLYQACHISYSIYFVNFESVNCDMSKLQSPGMWCGVHGHMITSVLEEHARGWYAEGLKHNICCHVKVKYNVIHQSACKARFERNAGNSEKSICPGFSAVSLGE